MNSDAIPSGDSGGQRSWGTKRPSARAFAGLPLHPFLFAAYAVLALLAVNLQEVPLGDTVRSFILAMTLAGCALGVFWLVTRNPAKAGLLATLIVIAFFSYGHLYAVFRGVEIGGLAIGRHRYLVAGLLLLVGGVGVAILRTRRPLNEGNRILNLAGAAALVAALVPIAAYARASVIQGQNPWGGQLEAVRLNPPSGETPPDVYYIILDGYARSDYMEAEFGFDNGEFISFLEERGFYVAEASRPNYVWTGLSLSSSLNMEFVQNLGLPLVPGSYPSLLAEPIRHSRVRQALEAEGYSTVALSSGWPTTEIVDADTYLAVDSVDVTAPSGPAGAAVFVTPFESQLLFTTPLRLLPSDIFYGYSNWAPGRAEVYPHDVMREIILGGFQNLGQAAALPGPKFVFAHIIAPHSPYLFTADGEPVPQEGPFTLIDPSADAGGAGDISRYRDQAIFVTRKIEAAIDSILRNSPSRPIIILQADHGPGAGETWKGLDAPGLGHRTSILNAYLLPASCRDSLYPSITPVNSFRVVFDCAFGTSLPLLPDRTYYSPNPRGGDYTFLLIEEPPQDPDG